MKLIAVDIEVLSKDPNNIFRYDVYSKFLRKTVEYIPHSIIYDINRRISRIDENSTLRDTIFINIKNSIYNTLYHKYNDIN
jgi:hypothetical protein